ncbi:hypothetical protein RhiirA4_465106 [Rhizophagus irregularis]|uniref:DUF8211 domain-containing protein n=1 Tax=Rhizophagus irregularis TaxID=588596 RepID=A0A2I1GRE9_9GLOM|nr:hypothetical protein RhiirA4_465106 [Rhizophagus irregularis]
MTPFDSITIDWSTPHSFVRIDDPQLSQNYLHNPLEDKNTLISPTQDKVALIDNNTPITPLTSHITNSTCIDNSFLISFKKFHVTKIHKAGYNKIYEFRRSKSFFFEIADHNLDTNQIHLKIHTNDYHMSTSPIKYRFYFGIYIPCDHSIELKVLCLPPSSCELPLPIVKSNNRHACDLHFFKKYQEKTHFVRNNNGELVKGNHQQDKKFHANLTFERWQNKETKIISSLRTGISYNSRYIVSNTRTAAKQKQRFERSCRRVLKEQVIKPGAVSNVSSKLAAAKKCNFLFLPSQKITRPVKHLHYKKVNTVPSQKDYNFIIPQYFPKEKTKRTNIILPSIPIQDESNVLTLTPEIDNTYSIAPYNPIPDMFIPVKYRDIIPPDPIYDDSGSFILPGSREWFTFMYQLDLRTRDERAAKAKEAQMAKRRAELEAESIADELRQRKAQEEHRIKREKIFLENETRKKAYALYHGTSPKHVDFRHQTTSILTVWCNEFHNNLVNPRTLPVPKKKKKKKQSLKTEMDSFLINYPGVITMAEYQSFNSRTLIKNHMGELIPLHPYTSDDTKELEKRPLKRDVNQNHNLRSFQDISKWVRLDSTLASDSEQAGSSNSIKTI